MTVAGIRDLVKAIVEDMVLNKEQVEIKVADTRTVAVIYINVHEDDRKWIIGRSWKFAEAMQTICTALGKKGGKNVIVEIVG